MKIYIKKEIGAVGHEKTVKELFVYDDLQLAETALNEDLNTLTQNCGFDIISDKTIRATGARIIFLTDAIQVGTSLSGTEAVRYYISTQEPIYTKQYDNIYDYTQEAHL